MQYLFQVSIGPVQNFISAARRTRDLKFGSELLSELSKAAAKTIAINPDNILIFPTPPNPEALNPNSTFNAANKIVALISGSPKDKGGKEQKDLADGVYEAIQARLHTFRKEAKGFHELPESYRGIADAQLKDLVEYFWVALPYSGDYNAVREKVEALMAARKNSRNFSPVTWGSNQDKSSIDGQLESVIPKSLYPHSWENSALQHSKARDLFRDFRAKPGEHLSGVDLLKRNGPLKGDSFPSTSHFVTIPFLRRLETLNEETKKQLKQSWDTYIETLEKVARIEHLPTNLPRHPILGNCEGSMLLEERFSDLVDFREDLQRCKPAKEKLHKFFELVGKQFQGASPKVSPGTYYAILRADGDSMGKVIDNEAEQGNEQHRRLSQELARFAGQVRAIVEEKYHGSLIYAGGDDVLAFMPLHTVLQCAQELSKTFYSSLQNFKTKDGNSPTLSVGIAVIHHLQPLREALELARNAEEKIAKQVKDKNALAITISKRSGSDFTIQGHWPNWKQEASQSLVSFAEYLNELIQFCRQESIPQGTAYELRDMALRLEIQADNSGDEAQKARKEQTKKEMQTVIKAEATRILERKLTHHRLNNPDDEAKSTEKRHERVAELLGQTHNVIEFANELIAAQLFADAMELAGLEKGTQQ